MRGKLINLTEISIGELDDTVLTYNGSVIPVPDHPEILLCAYRATKKPGNNLPSYPYQTINGNLWTNYDNYIGIAVLDAQTFQVKHFIKHMHNDGDHSHGGEDPRLYLRGKQIYMNYNAVSLTAPCPKKDRYCIGMFEIPLPLDAIMKLPFGSTKTVDGVLVCEKYIKCQNFSNCDATPKDLFEQSPLIKNWSYSPGYFIDSYNDKSFLYLPTETQSPTGKLEKDYKNCVRLDYPFSLRRFVLPKWSVALTTPSIEYNGRVYGVAHIRIGWSLLKENIDLVPEKIRKIIEKGDVHVSDFYFMSVYQITKSLLGEHIWVLSNPFLITGKTSKNYYSYNVNFPCGLYIDDKGDANITFGLGDCLLMLFQYPINSFGFTDRQFGYEDLIAFDRVKDETVKKEVINHQICKMSFNKYILPKFMVLFDLGGSGLKMKPYSPISNYYGEEIRLPKINQKINIRQLQKSISAIQINSRMNIEDLYKNSAGFAYSLANIHKLWDDDAWNQYTPEEQKQIESLDIEVLFGLHNSPTVVLRDATAHLLGSRVLIENKMIDEVNVGDETRLLNIAIGTGINAEYMEDNGEPVDISEGGHYFWDNKILIRENSQKKIYNVSDFFRKILPNQSAENQELMLTLFFSSYFDESDKSRDFSVKFKWPLLNKPNVITLSGGVTNGYADLEFSNGNQTVIVLKDGNIPYIGLVSKFQAERCT